MPVTYQPGVTEHPTRLDSDEETQQRCRAGRLGRAGRRPFEGSVWKAAALGVVGVLAAAAAATAGGHSLSGTPTVTPWRPSFVGIPVSSNAQAEVVITGSEIAAATQNSATTVEPDLAASLRDEMVAQAAVDGASITPDEVSIASFHGGAVLLAGYGPVTVEGITLTLDKFELTASLDSSFMGGSEGVGSAPPDTRLAAWPLASVSKTADSSYWAFDRSPGSYRLVVKDWGDAVFLWKREKLHNDGDAAKDYFTYSRKASAYPFKLRFSDDPKVRTLRVQSFPYDELEPKLVDWLDWNPGANFSGGCSGQMSVGISHPAVPVSLGYTFQDCDKYTFWRNGGKPGSYWIEMDQGRFLNDGPREAAYALGFITRQGARASMHDLNLVVFNQFSQLWGSQDKACKQTDAGRNC